VNREESEYDLWIRVYLASLKDVVRLDWAEEKANRAVLQFRTAFPVVTTTLETTDDSEQHICMDCKKYVPGMVNCSSYTGDDYECFKEKIKIQTPVVSNLPGTCVKCMHYMNDDCNLRNPCDGSEHFKPNKTKKEEVCLPTDEDMCR
jgi:hypothetical protein